MLKEGKYLLGTISEIANELYNSEEKIFKNRFRECDFALVDTEDFDLLNESLDVIYENSIGFYGIKKIDTGFDNDSNDNVDLFADYYGGGCGTYVLLGDWDSKDYIVKNIIGMIFDVLSYQEGTIYSNDIIICELK